ncbi:sugar phosphate permease [Novosphingobium kunmingense]|uniref:Sugar phosphate permease n=1 Tax=Novosphingobium kunmingense TaxID=1211806 RepID=A0A2N0HJT4_9SPHN|nr:MFS transporter [Novosphingobium kunmingense]PKB19207.1 sugar phosphate permease [Novosphingobium kunmingense]
MASAAYPQRVSTARLNWIVALVALAVLLNYVDRGAIGIAAPLMKAELGLSATGFGTAVSAFFWAYAPLCLVVGWLCDRFCVYRMFAAGIALWALATLLTGFVSGLALLIVLRLLLGLGESIAFPGSSKIFAAEVPATSRGMANAMVAAAIAFGPAVGTLSGGLILEGQGWRPIFWIFGAVTLLWLVPWQAAAAPLRSGNVAVPVVDPVPLGRLLRVPTVWLVGVGHFCTNYGFYFLLTWLPLYLVKERGLSIGDMTVLTTLGFAVQGVMALVMGRASDRWVQSGADEARVRRLLMVAGQALIAVAIGAVFFAHSPVAVGACLVLAGFATSLLSTNVFAIAQMFAGPRAAGGWTGIQNMIGNTSGIVGPIATGLMIDRLGGYGWAFALTALVPALGALWWWKAVPPIRQFDAA